MLKSKIDPGSHCILRAPRRRAVITLAVRQDSSGTFAICMEKIPCVYLLASGTRGTLYIGVTSNLVKRVWEHRSDAIDGFTKRYNVHLLVWFEQHESMYAAIEREKALKCWKRAWKLELVERTNPSWRDLYSDIAV